MKNYYSLSNRFLKTFFAIVLLLLSNEMFAQVDVTSSGGTSPVSYTTLKGAFDAINIGTHTGTITINISGNTNEGAATAKLDSSGNGTASSYTSILIRPTGGAARTISGATTAAAAMIELSGADNVTFDGLNTGGNSLTIENTTISATSGTSTVRFVNDATSNTITNCSVNGASTMTTTTNGGTIFFSTASSSTSTGLGNDNNTISFCNIGPSAGNSPAKAIYGNGSTTIVGNYNSNITITNCNIFDYFVQGTSNGMYISGGNTDWTISNNRFYQTGVRTTTATSVSTAVQISSATAGNNFLISNNTIGFANSSGTGFSSFTSSTGTVAYRAFVISTALTGLPCVISGNTVSGISVSTSGSGSTTASMFAGAIVSGGLVNLTNNTIGSLTGANSISFTSSSTSTAIEGYGIYYGGASINNITGNSIGNITLSNSSTGSMLFYGIRSNSSSTAGIINTISNNTIGSTLGPISNTATATSSRVVGIQSDLGQPVITGNTITNISTASAAVGATTTASILGIYNSATSTNGGQLISQNTIRSLTNTTASAAVSVTGILNTGAATTPTAANVISRNFIHSLSASSTAATLNGIFVIGGIANYQNNMIRLGSNISVAFKINGIQETGAGALANNYYFNTVYIGGTGVGSTVSNTYAYQNLYSGSGARAVQNNIFINARSNSTTGGKHYAVMTAGTAANPAGLTINYNLYRATGTGGVFGLFNAADVATLAAWRTAVGQDVNSINTDPCLANPDGLPTVVDLHLTNCASAGSPAESAGLAIAGITDDFDAQTRASFSPTDIGADAGLYGAAGKDVGISALVRPTATSCHSASEDVIVTVTNFSDPINFSVDNVTINVVITGVVSTSFNTVLMSGTLAPGASMNITMGQINTTANGTYTFTSSTTLAGDINAGNNTLVSNVVINYTPVSVTATASLSSICLGNATVLTASPLNGTLPYSYSWTPGGATTNPATVSPTANTTYTVTVTDACNVTATANVSIIVDAQTISSITPGSRCGTGTVPLSAVPGGSATIRWYAAASGGAPLSTLNSFTTPTISATTTYYVSARGPGSPSTGGRPAPATNTSATGLFGVIFDANQNFDINSVEIYPATATGSITVELRNSSNVTLESRTVAITGGSLTTPFVVPLNIAVYQGTGYRLVALATHPGMVRETSLGGFPYSLGANGSITGSTSGTTYYFFYNWSMTQACESPRQAVVATVTPPPAVNVTIAPGTSVCKGETVSLTAVSPTNDPNYTYTWSFNGIATAGTGSGFSFLINKDSTVYFTAEDLNGASPNFGCRFTSTTLFTVRDSASTPIVSPASAVSCVPSTCHNLTVTNATTLVPVLGTIGTQTTTIGGSNGNPYRSGTTANADVKTQILVLASELSAAGLSAGNLTSLACSTTAAAGTVINFAIRIGHTSVTTLTTTYESTPMTTVFTQASFSPALGLNTHTFGTTFPWNGTSNIIVEFCQTQSVTGTTTISCWTPTYTPNIHTVGIGFCASAITGTNVTPKPVMTFGGFFGAPATYSWNPGALTGSTVNVCPATTTTYTVTTTNAAACSKSKSVVIDVSNVAYTSSTPVNVSCNGGSDGSITISATGTYTPLQYSINNGTSYQASNVFSGLTAGSYNVKVKDALNCATTAQLVNLTQPSAITFTGTPANVTCYGANDGSITISAEAGGNGGPYTYSKDNGSNYQGSAIFTGLTAGTYQVRIKDALGCVSAATAVVVGTTPAIQYTITATASAGGTISPSGSVSVDCGANLLFTMTANSCYQLDSVYVDGINAGNSGTYTFTSVMANHTIHAYFNLINYTVTATNGINGTISTPGVTNATCGSNLTYTMFPDPGNIVDSVTVDGVSVGQVTTYTFTNITANHTIDVKFTTCTTPATANAGPNAAVCSGLNHTLAGSIGGSASTGTWSTSGTGTFSPNNDFATATTYIPSAADRTAGSVILTLATDNPAGPCPAASAAMLLTINPLPTVSISGQVEICSGGSTTLTANASGTITGYQWDLNGVTTLGTNQTQTASSIGTYNVVVTNNNSCTNSASAVTTSVDNPVVSISGTSPICIGTSTTLTANVTLTNGTVASYLWSLNGISTGITTPTASVTLTGTYTVVATSNFGCIGTSSSFVLSNATGPLSGLYTINTGIPVSCTNFHSFKDALTALNSNGVAGNVTVDVSAGHTETAPAGGLKIDACGMSPSLQPGAAQTVTFQKSGAGANPKITAQVGTGSLDGIVVIIGGDYITFNGIDLAENPANTTSTTRAEWGYALLKCSGTDGSNNNVIKNCTVTLNKSNTSTVGIYVNNHLPINTLALTVTATSGENSNNIFIDNTITNSYSGIGISGFGDVTPYALYDQNNEVGQTGHGNILTNLGGSTSTCLGIYTAFQNNLKVIANNINSTGTGVQTGTMYGIFTDYSGNANTDIIGNTVTIIHGVGATGQHIAIINNSGSRLGRPTSSSVNNIVSIKNNTVQNCAYPGNTTTLGAWIYSARSGPDTMSAYNVIITGNQLINNTYSSTGATGTLYGIISQSLVDSASISNNTISNNTVNGSAALGLRAIVTGYGGFGTGTVPYVYKLNVSGNTINNNVSTATTGVVDNIAVETYTGSSALAGSKVTIRDNTIGSTTITAISTAAYNGITASPSVNSTLDVSKNTVTNIIRNNSTTGAFSGIVLSGTSTVSVKLDSNVVSNVSHTGATSGAWTGISNAGSTTLTTSYSAVRNTVSGNTHNGTGTMGLLINGNANSYVVTNNSVLNNTKTTASTGIVNGLTITGSTTLTASINASNNTVTGNTFGGTSTMTVFDGGGSLNTTVSGNTVSNNSKNGPSGIMYCIRAGGASTSTVTYSNNTVNNNTSLNTSTATITTIYGIYNLGTPGTEVYDNNTVSNLAIGGAGTGTHTIYGIYSSTAAASNKTISNNKVSLLSTDDASSGTIYGIYTSTGTTINLYKNKVFDLQKGGASGSLNGIYVNSGVTVNVYNNYVGNLATPFANLAHALIGIFVNGGTTSNIMFNTVRIGGMSSSGAEFGSSGIYASTTPSVNLQNNIIINLAVPSGATGASVAYRRSSATLTTYAATSNNNIFYAGSPGAARLIYGEGTGLPTNPQQTIALYKTYVGPTRDLNSQTENVTFQSLTGSNALFLHVDAGIPTLVESGATPISSPVAITDDYDGDVRDISTPDIGADEDNFVSAALSITALTASPGSQCTAVSHLITATIVTGTTAVSSATLNYAFNGIAQTPITMVNSSSNFWTATIPAATPSNALVTYSVTASDAGFTKISNGISYKDNYLSGFSMLTTANPNPVCANSTTTLNAVVGGPGVAVVGAGATTSATYSNPFYSLWSNAHDQLLITAAELHAAGLTQGNITSLGLTMTSAGTLPMIDFSLSIGATNATNMLAYITSGLSTKFTSASFLPVLGLNTMTFSSPFNWDGTSNIVVEICHGNSASTATMSRTCEFDNTSYVSNIHTHKTVATSGTAQCPDLATNLTTYTGRPKLTFNGIVGPTGFTYAWSASPAGNGLNAVSGASVTATPTIAGVYTYTVIGTDNNGCSVSGSINVTVNPQPATPTANPSTQCGYGIPLSSVIGGGGLFSWYLTPTGGSPIAGETGASLTTYAISNTTTFYVSENDGTCNSARAAVIATVNQPDIVTATATPSSICLNESLTLNAAQTGSTNTYLYTWTANPSSGSGISGSASGSSVVITPTAAGTYTYLVTANDAGLGCTYINTVVATVKALPSITSAIASPSSVCAGGSVTLTALTGSFATGLGTIGTGTTSTISGNDGNPLRSGNGVGNQIRSHMLILASELTAQGFVGGPISSLAFVNGTTASGGTIANFEIKIGHTALSAFSTTTFETTPMTSVYTNPSITFSGTVLPTFTFSTPFVWNGTSNIIINTCETNSVTGTSYILATTPGFNAHLYKATATTSCADLIASVSMATRPVMILNGTTSSFGAGTYNWQWNPGALNGNSVVVTPGANTTYVVTATDPVTSCSATASVPVTVNPLPAAPIGFNSSHCGSGVPNCAVDNGVGGIHRWYLTPTGGTPLPGETNPYLVSYTISTTTTFYVSEYDGLCEGPRTAVVEDVFTTDPVTASANPLSACPGTVITLSAAQTGTTSSYTFDWTSSPQNGSGISGLISGQSVMITPTTSGVYTYTVTATDFNTNCVTNATVSVNIYALPVITSATASPSTICSGNSVTLTALTGTTATNTVAIGTATTTSTLTGVNPLSPFWESNRVQYLIKASELTAQGLVAGNISQLAFKITAKGTLTFDWLNYTIKMAHTSSTALTTTFEAPAFQTVFGPTTIPAASVVIGYNGIALTPFNWNGTSNIIVDICFANDPTATCAACYNPTASLTFEYTSTSYNSVNYDVIDDISNCGATNTGTTSLLRPNFLITGQSSALGAGTYSWSWNPGSLSGNSVVVTPMTSTTYTVKATDPVTTCSNTASVSVIVNPTPAAPLLVSASTQCGYGIPTCAVSGGGGVFNWYLAPTGGTPLAGESSTTLSAYAISTTTTFFVSEFDGTCEGARTTVIATVTPADPVTVTATPTAVCLGGTINLLATKTGTTNTYSYAWTATPSAGSGISGPLSGANVLVTPTVAGTYTYHVTAFDATLGCTALSSTTVVVNSLPVISSATANPSTICAGSSTTLTALTGSTVSGTAIIGTQTTTIGGSTGNPLRTSAGTNFRIQLLVLASELSGQGISAGPLTSLGFTTTGAAGTLANYVISLGHTSSSSLTTTYDVSPLTTVLTQATVTPVVGLNNFVFTTPFNWNGTSNVLINICSDPGTTGTTTVATGLPAGANVQGTGAGACAALTGTAAATRPVMQIGGLVSGAGAGTYNWVWNPGNLSGNSVVVSPSVNTTYTVTATDPLTNCTSTATAAVNVLNAVGSTPIAVTSTDSLCGPGAVSLSVTNPGAGLTYIWQKSSSGNINTWSNIGTGILFTTGTVSTDTYYRVYATCGASSDTSASHLVIVSNPTILGTSNGNRCGAGPVTLTVSGIGNFDWFDAPVGGTHVGTGASYTASYGVTTTVYAQASIGSCVYAGGRIPATATINASPSASIVAVPDTTVCAGTVLNFTASSANANYTYSWSIDGINSLGTGNTFVSAPNVSTVYYLLATDNVPASPFFGCGYQATKFMTVVPNPVTPIVSPVNPSICTTGGSVTLTVTNPDLTGATIYVWNPGNDTATSKTISPTSNVTYTVTASNQTIVGTNIAPLAVATSSGGGASPDYGPALLNDGLIPACDIAGILQWGWVTTNGTYTYTWSSNQTFGQIIFYDANRPFTTIGTIEYSNNGGASFTPIATNFANAGNGCNAGDPFGRTDTLNFTPVTGNVLRFVTIAGSNPNFREIKVLTGSTVGGCTVTTTVPVVYAPLTAPVISASGSTTICPGNSVTLDAGSGYTNYSWSNGASVVATTQTYAASPASTTTYTVSVDNGTICSKSDSKVVTVSTLPPPTVTSNSTNGNVICEGGNVTLDAGAGYDTYSWSDGAGVVGTLQTYSASPTVMTTYTVTVTLNGCPATSSGTQVTVNPNPPTAVITPTGPISLCSDGSNSPVTLTADITGAPFGSTIVWNQDGNPSTGTISVSAGDIDLLLNSGVYGYNFQVTDPATGCFTVSNTVTVTDTQTCSGPTLFAKLFLEGYYSGSGDMNTSGSGGCLFITGGSLNPLDADNVTLSAMSSTFPHPLVESQTGILKTDGSINVTFTNAVSNGGSYYIKVTHRNALETWSAAPVVLSATTALSPYDFSSAQTQAYGSNLSDLFDGNWAIFSGDISDAGTATVGIQDAIIESQDYGDMENAVYVTLLGYVTEDITGDGIVESADYGLMENNVYFTRVLQRP